MNSLFYFSHSPSPFFSHYPKAGDGGRCRTLSARKCRRVAHCDRPRLKAIVSALAPNRRMIERKGERDGKFVSECSFVTTLLSYTTRIPHASLISSVIELFLLYQRATSVSGPLSDDRILSMFEQLSVSSRYCSNDSFYFCPTARSSDRYFAN